METGLEVGCWLGDLLGLVVGSFDGLDVTGFDVGEELVGDAATGR